MYDCNQKYHAGKLNRILVICGPGSFFSRENIIEIDNGGDGYAAARHLKQFGFNPKVMNFKTPEKPHFLNLINACQANEISVVQYNPEKDTADSISDQHDMVVDGIFGFSFKGPIKPPYDQLLVDLKKISIPIFSIDNPSGWEIEKGTTQ